MYTPVPVSVKAESVINNTSYYFHTYDMEVLGKTFLAWT